MSETDLHAAEDATELARRIRAGEISPGEALDCAIAAVETIDPAINSVAHKNFELARAAVAAGLPDGPFRGVPILLKDTGTAVAGMPLSLGSKLFEGPPGTVDATLATRLKAAGFVPIGRSNVPELALSFTTEPVAFGPTRNPWATDRSVGGSSGGSAAAVAAGIVTLAHASDGAGSIRVPSAHCGVFGFKPSRIRNPLGPAIAEGNAGMATAHGITRSVRDSAALLDALSGPDIGDPYAVPPPARPFLSELDADPKPLRIGLVTRSTLGVAFDAACLDAVQDAARLCEGFGHFVEPAEFGLDEPALKRAWRIVGGVGAAASIAARLAMLGLEQPGALLEPVNRVWFEEGKSWSGTDYLAAVTELHRAARALGRFFARYDILLSPMTATPAPRLGELASGGTDLDAFFDHFWHHAPFAPAFNAAGCPAMSMPLGHTAPFAGAPRGLPVGVHFGAGFGQDGLLFALAGQIERARPWADRRPPFPFPTDIPRGT